MRFSLSRLPQRQLKILFAFLALAFLTNFTWEIFHGFLYRGITISAAVYVSVITRASLIDMVWLGILFVGFAIYFRNFNWFRNLTKQKYLAILLIPLIVAILIEIKGVYIFHDWSYTKMMPKLWGLGLSPLLQLPLTMFFSTLFIANMKK